LLTVQNCSPYDYVAAFDLISIAAPGDGRLVVTRNPAGAALGVPVTAHHVALQTGRGVGEDRSWLARGASCGLRRMIIWTGYAAKL